MTQSLQFPITEELIQQFTTAQDANVRALHIEIVNEAIVFVGVLDASDDIAQDCEKMKTMLKKDDAAYFAFKLPDASWVLIAYIPDSCPVKQRMLYASSSEHVRKGLGSVAVPIGIHCSDKAEMSWDAIDASVKYKKNPPTVDLRTSAEATAAEEKKAVIAEGVTKQYVHCVQAGFTDDARAAITRLQKGESHAVILQMDKEIIAVETEVSEKLVIEDVASKLCKTEPRFLLFRFEAEHEGTTKTANVFVYICPEGCKVQHRMTYSTTKASVVTTAADLGLSLDKKMELGDAADLTTQAIYDTLYPPQAAEEKKFTKPTRPGKGKARLTE